MTQPPSRSDFVRTIGRTVDLDWAGTAFSGACPSHRDVPSSLYVHPGKEFFFCFGCGASGSAQDWATLRARSVQRQT